MLAKFRTEKKWIQIFRYKWSKIHITTQWGINYFFFYDTTYVNENGMLGQQLYLTQLSSAKYDFVLDVVAYDADAILETKSAHPHTDTQEVC